MVNGEFRRHGGTMVLDGIATGMGIPGNRDQSKVRNRVQVTTIGLMSKRTGSVGSMIINPLLFDMTCETTGGLRFVHEHEVADMETKNRLVVDCKDFESELADTGCVPDRELRQLYS